jgi:hypothetical protein
MLDRRLLPLETRTSGLFAAGTYRASVKRIAATAGEASSVVRSVHHAVGN